MLRAPRSAWDTIQKVFAINSVCFNLLTKPDGQSLLRKTTAPESVDYVDSCICSRRKPCPTEDPSCLSFTAPKRKCDLFKINAFVSECSSLMCQTLPLRRNQIFRHLWVPFGSLFFLHLHLHLLTLPVMRGWRLQIASLLRDPSSVGRRQKEERYQWESYH